jgi:glutaconyl-CoA decarboxylase
MKPYIEMMSPMGKALRDNELKSARDNVIKIEEEERKILEQTQKVLQAGLPLEALHRRGEKSAWERIEMLVDPGTFLPLNTLYDPNFNEEGTTGVINGLGRISGRYASIIASNNRVVAGAWIPGQAENVFRAQDMAQRLNIPLVWILNCSGVKLTEQEEVYAGRRSGGRTFFRHAEFAQEGIAVIVGVYGTNPAGGGYHGISPAMIFAHKDANIAVGGGGIVSGMSPKGYFDLEGAEGIIEATKKFKTEPPGSVKIHYHETGFFKKVLDTEEGVIEALKKSMAGMPIYDPDFFRVTDPQPPCFPGEDLNALVPYSQKSVYDTKQVLSRIVDRSEHLEFWPDDGPEVYCGLVRLDGFLAGMIANRQGFLKPGYPEYADYPGIGGKLYRQGLIKMNEFVTLCGRDKIPLIWFQDTTGIDVGDLAEKAELLGLGQALIYSIEQSQIPMATVVLRKGSAAAHYIMGGPQANRNNAFTLGTPATEIYVMHGETASVAAFARRLVKEKETGNSLQPIIDKMNELATQYYDHSRPGYCAQRGFVDEIVPLPRIRDYLIAFARCCYQNPKSICPPHQMLLPRLIKRQGEIKG